MSAKSFTLLLFSVIISVDSVALFPISKDKLVKNDTPAVDNDKCIDLDVKETNYLFLSNLP
jgi:hypothetical protein